MNKHATKWGLIFVLPALVHLAIFRILPAIMIFYQIGIGKIGSELARLSSPEFGKILVNSFYYIGGTIVVFVPLSLVLAGVLFALPLRSQNIARTAYLLPFMTVFVAVGIIWKFGFATQGGFVNEILAIFGIDGPAWLGGSGIFAMPALIITTGWRFVGYWALIFFSGLQSVPRSLYEAAKIDGAGFFQTFRYITLPQIQPTTLFIIVIATVDMLRQFEIPKVMTEGGPFGSTEVLSLHIHTQAFTYFRMDTALVQTLVFMALALALSGFQFLVSKRLET